MRVKSQRILMGGLLGGTQPRPVTFIRRRRGALGSLLPGVEEMTLSLSVGEAVLFRGTRPAPLDT